MMSPFPWKLSENGDKIVDADGEVIAEDYHFLNMDDFEGLCKYVNLGAEAVSERNMNE